MLSIHLRRIKQNFALHRSTRIEQLARRSPPPLIGQRTEVQIYDRLTQIYDRLLGC
jgi:hypothetical protein